MVPKVLIVDDEATLRANMSAFLEDEGMAVETAESGEEALERIEQGLEVDVCVMDMRLPGIDGQETMMRIHRIRPHILFVVHTGTAGYTLPDELRQIGLSNRYVFPKPMPDMTLIALAIRALVENGEYASDD
jgi:CheY-like chemotaxis protein